MPTLSEFGQMLIEAETNKREIEWTTKPEDNTLWLPLNMGMSISLPVLGNNVLYRLKPVIEVITLFEYAAEGVDLIRWETENWGTYTAWIKTGRSITAVIEE